MGERTSYDRPDGNKVHVYRADPKREIRQKPRGAVIVLHEWYGLRADTERIGDRLAAEGYIAACPDLYHGKVAINDSQARLFMTKLDGGDAVKEDIRGVADALAAEGHKVCVMGFCLGGALTISSAVHVASLSSAVCFYGIPPAERADPSQVRVPILSHWANSDDWCTPEKVNALEQQFRDGKVTYEMYRYDAKHAFFNPARVLDHDPISAELAWTRTLSFLEKYVG